MSVSSRLHTLIFKYISHHCQQAHHLHSQKSQPTPPQNHATMSPSPQAKQIIKILQNAHIFSVPKVATISIFKKNTWQPKRTTFTKPVLPKPRAPAPLSACAQATRPQNTTRSDLQPPPLQTGYLHQARLSRQLASLQKHK